MCLDHFSDFVEFDSSTTATVEEVSLDTSVLTINWVLLVENIENTPIRIQFKEKK